MQVSSAIEEEDLLERVWCVILEVAIARLVAEKLELFHLSDVVQHLELLHQVVSHAFFDNHTASHVPSDGSLQDHCVLLEHAEDRAEPSHAEV